MAYVEAQGTGHATLQGGMMTPERHTVCTILVFTKIKGQL